MNPANFTNVIAPVAGFAAMIALFLTSLRVVIALSPRKDRKE